MTIDLKARDIQPLRNTYAHVAKYLGEGKAASRYEEATLGSQPTSNFHYRPTWDPSFEIFDTARSKVKLADWYVLRDPRQFYYATWTITRARQQEAIEANYQFIESRSLVAKMPEALRDRACAVLMPLRHVAWGGNMNNASIGAYGYGTAFTAPAMFHAMDHLAVAQFITRLGLTLADPSVLDKGKEQWVKAPQWQVLRRFVEDTFVVQDPFELFVAQNLSLDAQLYPLIFSSFVDDHLALQGGTAVSMLSAFMPEWHEESARWIDNVIKVAAAESEDNRNLIIGWAKVWADRAHSALAPIADLALGDQGAAALSAARNKLNERMKKIGIAS
jgi:phenol/toluene 2-monooxygenase (NADH) P1/A1